MCLIVKHKKLEELQKMFKAEDWRPCHKYNPDGSVNNDFSMPEEPFKGISHPECTYSKSMPVTVYNKKLKMCALSLASTMNGKWQVNNDIMVIAWKPTPELYFNGEFVPSSKEV